MSSFERFWRECVLRSQKNTNLCLRQKDAMTGNEFNNLHSNFLPSFIFFDRVTFFLFELACVVWLRSLPLSLALLNTISFTSDLSFRFILLRLWSERSRRLTSIYLKFYSFIRRFFFNFMISTGFIDHQDLFPHSDNIFLLLFRDLYMNLSALIIASNGKFKNNLNL